MHLHVFCFTQHLFNETWNLNIFNKEIWLDTAEKVFKEFQKEIYEAVHDKNWDGTDNVTTADLQWTFAGSMLYSVTVITTIGERAAPSLSVSVDSSSFSHIAGRRRQNSTSFYLSLSGDAKIRHPFYLSLAGGAIIRHPSNLSLSYDAKIQHPFLLISDRRHQSSTSFLRIAVR